MNAQTDRGTARLATISLILGVLSFGLVLIAIIIVIRLRLPGGPTDDASLFSLGFLAVFLMLGGLILGIPGWVIAVLARRKNGQGNNDPKINKIASTGLTLSGLGVVIVVVIFGYALIFQPNTPLPNPSTPIPSTAVP